MPSLKLGYVTPPNESSVESEGPNESSVEPEGVGDPVKADIDNSDEYYDVEYLEEPTKEKETQTPISNVSTGTQTDDNVTSMSSAIVISYQEKVALLEEMLESKNISLEYLRSIKIISSCVYANCMPSAISRN